MQPLADVLNAKVNVKPDPDAAPPNLLAPATVAPESTTFSEPRKFLNYMRLPLSSSAPLLWMYARL